MTRINYNGHVYLKISKTDWEFSGGEQNPDLLKLRNTRRTKRGYTYFRMREGINLDASQHEEAGEYM
jgi:hypothetical protein